MYEYLARSKWSGWWGGWGSEGDIATTINEAAKEGWRLSRTESVYAFWFWFIPRPKLLVIFEREASGGA